MFSIVGQPILHCANKKEYKKYLAGTDLVIGIIILGIIGFCFSNGQSIGYLPKSTKIILLSSIGVGTFETLVGCFTFGFLEWKREKASTITVPVQ